MKVLGPTLTSIAILLTIMLPSTAVAADSVFLKLDNIRVSRPLSGTRRRLFSSRTPNRSAVLAAAAGEASTSKADCGAITVTKLLDRSSPA